LVSRASGSVGEHALEPPSTPSGGAEPHHHTLSAPIFLVGSERSGTTLLRLMLDHHPQIAFEKEVDYIVEKVSPSGRMPAVGPYRDWLSTVRGADFDVDTSLDYRHLVKDVLRQKQEISGGKPFIGATVHRHFDRLRFIWPEARYIHLMRDPRDVARSIVQKGWAGNEYEAAEWWLNAEELWSAVCAEAPGERRHDLRYEDLVTHPVEELTRLCAFVGVKFDDAMLRYTESARQYPPPDPRLAFQWKTKMRPQTARLVEARVGPLLITRGYALADGSAPSVGRMRHEQLMTSARARRLRTRTAKYGVRLVAADVVGRRLGLSGLADNAQRRINAVEQRLIDQETAGLRSPSANIPPVGEPNP
jgi:Sulfotransferase family